MDFSIILGRRFHYERANGWTSLGPSRYTEKLPFDQQHRVNPRQEIMEVSTRGGGELGIELG